MPEDIRRALTGIEISELFGDGKAIGRLKKVRFAQKVAALDSLAKHLGGRVGIRLRTVASGAQVYDVVGGQVGRLRDPGVCD